MRESLRLGTRVTRVYGSYRAWEADGANITEIEPGRELHDENHSDWHVRLKARKR